MTEEPEAPGPRSHPLEGVLERLIARERGAGAPPNPVLGRGTGPAFVPGLVVKPPLEAEGAHAVGAGIAPIRPAESGEDASLAPRPAAAARLILGAPLLGIEPGAAPGTGADAGWTAAMDQKRMRPAPAHGADTGRRMLVIAGQGADRGQGVLEAVTRWAVRTGRFPAVLDLLDPEPAPSGEVGIGEEGWASTPPWHDPAVEPAAAEQFPNMLVAPQAGRLEAPGGEQAAPAGSVPASGRPGIPVASIPCGLDGLRDEPPELVAAVIDRLRRHELSADLLIVRVPAHPRMILMKAAFMAGGLVVPLDGSEQSLWEEFYLCQEVQQNFYGLTLWPWACDPAVLERFLTLLRNFLGIEAGGFDAENGDLTAVLGKLSAAPEDGYVSGLLAQSAASLPPRLLAITTLDL